MEITIDQALQQGVAAHKEGKLQEAEKFYRAILQLQPHNPDANHNLGILAIGVDKVEDAIPYFKAALAANAEMEQYWFSYIHALIKHGQLDNAKQVLKQAKGNGLKGNKIDQLETHLSGTVGPSLPIDSKNNPSKEQFDSLVALYSQGNFEQVLVQGSALAIQFPNDINIQNILGAVYSALGDDEEAAVKFNQAIKLKPDYAEAHNNLGNVLNNLGEQDKAITSYNKAIELKPDYSEAHYNLGNVLDNLGEHEEALTSYNKAVKLNPKKNEAHYNLGNALTSLGEYDEAITSYNKAIELKPDFAEAHNNLGNAFNQLDEHEEAITSYNKAIELKPDYAKAHYNLGNALNNLGKHEEAINSYNKAIELKPGYVEAHYNLGNALNNLGKHGEAINSYNKAIELKPGYVEAYVNLGISLSRLKVRGFSAQLAKNYLDVLNFRTMVRPSAMIVSIITLLKHHDIIKEVINYNEQNALKNLASECCIKLSELRLFLKIMEICPIPDFQIEGVLTELRRILLLERSKLWANHDLLSFQNSLALQCFTNEFIYKETKEETIAIKSLETSLQQLFSNNEQHSSYDIACLAAYRPLCNYQWVTDITPPPALELLFKRQVVEVNQELLLKEDIPSLNPIKDEVSLAVKNQYEESPYPRWVNTALEIESLSIKKILANAELKAANDIAPLSEAPQILIAGCGTGQHALGSASRFKNSHITAIDLSLSSLGYAKRKTEELGITNIDYLQADILDLGMLGKQFEIIESSGVLHHMADPISGWKVLTDCLKPNGLMRIGLYSQLARRHIVKARCMISEKNISSNKEGMLEFRRQINKLHDPELNILKTSNDFYSTSTVRDLLFHVQEHRFTIPQISEVLDKLGLAFMGFEFSDKTTKEAFKMAYPKEGAIYNLDIWHEYETSNPKLFASMYQFWVQKL